MAAGDNMREIPFQEISQAINNNIEGAENLRIAELSQLLKIRKAKEKQQVRELKRVRAQYGEKDPRNNILKTKLAHNERMVNELRREEVRIKTVVPEVDKKSWVVYGYVRNRKLEPLDGLILGLYRADNSFLDQIGTVTTNKEGYFEFRYNGKTVAGKEGTEKAEIGPEKVETLYVNRQRITKQFSVCIQVMDKNKKRLYLDKRSLIPRAGAVEYRDIVIPGEINSLSGKAQRYLGNSNSRELHDLNNEKTGCKINSIRFDHKVFFENEKDAIQADYDYCAYCFGKRKSKR